MKFDYYGGANVICSDCVEEAVKSVKDFESLALEWKDNYHRMKRELDVKIIHLEQTIEDLKNELIEVKEHVE